MSDIQGAHSAEYVRSEERRRGLPSATPARHGDDLTAGLEHHEAVANRSEFPDRSAAGGTENGRAFGAAGDAGEGHSTDRRTVGSLFSGIGGIDLGLERAGFQVIWQSELDPYASRVLAKHWPDVPNLGDVTTIDWSTVERPDVVAGGFPCQPVSVAGRRRGQADERWLWPEVARCLRHLRPRWALLENVPGLLVQPMGDVLGDLATLGYDAEWQGIPAAAVGAPHLRWRIFIAAQMVDTQSIRRQRGMPARASSGDGTMPQGSSGGLADAHGVQEQEKPEVAAFVSGQLAADDWRRALREPGAGAGRRVEHGNYAARDRGCSSGPAAAVDPEGLANSNGTLGRPAWGAGEAVFGPSPVERSGRCGCCNGNHWAVEPDVGRVAHGIPSRVDRLRCLGNAVVPQVAEYVGRRLLAHIDGPIAASGEGE